MSHFPIRRESNRFSLKIKRVVHFYSHLFFNLSTSINVIVSPSLCRSSKRSISSPHTRYISVFSPFHYIALQNGSLCKVFMTSLTFRGLFVLLLWLVTGNRFPSIEYKKDPPYCYLGLPILLISHSFHNPSSFSSDRRLLYSWSSFSVFRHKLQAYWTYILAFLSLIPLDE